MGRAARRTPRSAATTATTAMAQPSEGRRERIDSDGNDMSEYHFIGDASHLRPDLYDKCRIVGNCEQEVGVFQETLNLGRTSER